jgi:O-antigen/teichoic acid export membrane protein
MLGVAAPPVSMEDTTPATPFLASAEAADVRGVRAGLVTFVGIAAANGATYVFNFVSARYLGPRSYADIATLTALISLIGLPLAAIQFVVARDVARILVARGAGGVASYVGRAFATMVAVGLVATAVFLVAVPLVRTGLHIRSSAAITLTAIATSAAFAAPVLIGASQGLQRFGIVAAALAVGPLARIPLLAAVLAAGWGVAGAMGATFVSGAISVVIPAALLGRTNLRIQLRPRLPSWERVTEVAPVLIGVLALTGLTTDDLLVAKAAFDNHTAGIYSSASLIGRVLLYLPGAIVTVLLPKVASRAAANRDTRDILRSSLLVTAGFCLAGCIAYAAAGSLVVRIVFGSSYAAASGLLWRFGIAMTAYAVLNVLLTYTLGHRRTATAWLLGVGLVVQSVAFAVFHASPVELVTASIAVAVALVVAHEALVLPVLRPQAKARRRPAQ